VKTAENDLSKLTKIIDRVYGKKPEKLPFTPLDASETPGLDDVSTKKTQKLNLSDTFFAEQKPLKKRAAPYFFKAEQFFNSGESALKNEADKIAAKRFETANKYYARGFKNLYSEVLSEQDYYKLRRLIKHYSASLDLCNHVQRAVEDLRRIGRFLMNRKHWWTAQVALDEAVELIDAYNLPTGGKEQQYLKLTELMILGELINEPNSQLIEFAKQEKMLDNIGYTIRNGQSR